MNSLQLWLACHKITVNYTRVHLLIGHLFKSEIAHRWKNITNDSFKHLIWGFIFLLIRYLFPLCMCYFNVYGLYVFWLYFFQVLFILLLWCTYRKSKIAIITKFNVIWFRQKILRRQTITAVSLWYNLTPAKWVRKNKYLQEIKEKKTTKRKIRIRVQFLTNISKLLSLSLSVMYIFRFFLTHLVDRWFDTQTYTRIWIFFKTAWATIYVCR